MIKEFVLVDDCDDNYSDLKIKRELFFRRFL